MDERAGRERDLSPGQYVSICGSDTGASMTPDVIAKAFDPFFTTKPIGQTRIYSEVGQGSVICPYLPRHHGAVEVVEKSPELAVAPRAGRGETVLVVDDEPRVRMLVTDVLKELGYAAIEAVDGASGLRILQSGIRIDLLVSDVGLSGGMIGRQRADAGWMSRPNLRGLFITGYAEDVIVGNGRD